MAWVPSTSFEEDLVAYQPDFNFIHGQLTYEIKRKQDVIPRPISTYEHMTNRNTRNKKIERANPSTSEEIRDSLAMMERIQQIAGTKPLGEHASMSDWEDTSTVEREAVAMMRHFGMNSMADGKLEPSKTKTLPQGKIYVARNGVKNFPIIMDPSYFEPGRKRKDSNNDSSMTASSDKSNDSIYFSADSHYDDAKELVSKPKPQTKRKSRNWKQ